MSVISYQSRKCKNFLNSNIRKLAIRSIIQYLQNSLIWHLITQRRDKFKITVKDPGISEEQKKTNSAQFIYSGNYSHHTILKRGKK